MVYSKINKKGNAGGTIVLLIIILGLTIAGYSYLKYKDFDFSFGKKTNQSIVFENCTQTECICNDPDFPYVDTVAYYFDNETYAGLDVFIDNSDKYLHCAFTSLESQVYASEFIALKKQGLDVKIQFGIDDTMSSCETLCVPKLESQYNYLLGEGVPVGYSGINFNFCVNEKAVYLFSLVPGGIQRQDYGLIIFSTGLRDKYEKYFEEVFE